MNVTKLGYIYSISDNIEGKDVTGNVTLNTSESFTASVKLTIDELDVDANYIYDSVNKNHSLSISGAELNLLDLYIEPMFTILKNAVKEAQAL